MLQTVRRIGPVLDLFTQEQPSWGTTEIAEKMGISRSSAHELLSSMTAIGLLYTPGRSRYWVGRKIRDLGDVLLCTADVHRAALPAMHQLHELTGETVHLAVLDDGRAICVETLVGLHAVFVEGPPAGAPVDLRSSAVGKAILAYQPTPTTSNGRTLVRTAQRPDADHLLLERERSRVLASGFAYDRGETVEHVHCVAGPVLDNTGRAVAAIGLAVPASRFDRGRVGLTQMLKQKVLDASQRLGRL